MLVYYYYNTILNNNFNAKQMCAASKWIKSVEIKLTSNLFNFILRKKH